MATLGKTVKTNKVHVDNDGVVHRDWTQTDKSTHGAWCALGMAEPKASALLHKLVQLCDKQGAVVASIETIAEIMNCSESTIKRAVAVLKAGNWIQVASLSGRGSVNAYVINSKVCWSDKREKMNNAIFTANIICARRDQDEVLPNVQLKRIPMIFAKQE